MQRSDPAEQQPGNSAKEIRVDQFQSQNQPESICDSQPDNGSKKPVLGGCIGLFSDSDADIRRMIVRRSKAPYDPIQAIS